MERNEEDDHNIDVRILKTSLFLDSVGEVVLCLNSDGLCWELLHPDRNEDSICLGIKLAPKIDTEIKFSDVYAVELIGRGFVQEYRPIVGRAFTGSDSCDPEMYRFCVHGVRKSVTQPCLWVPAEYTFGHKDLQTCQIWVDRINEVLRLELGRPKNLLVFVHPLSGKANGRKNWETVAPIFSRAKVETKVIVTKRAGHAFDVMKSTTNKELSLYDGVIAVGGDGFFNEILNGLLLSRYKAPYPPSPSELAHSDNANGSALSPNAPDPDARENDVNSPLLSNSTRNGPRSANMGSEEDTGNTGNQDPEFPLPNERFRFGIIPAGSTDAIVMCTTGTRDPITSALQIVLGEKVCLDIAQVVRWKMFSTSDVEPCVRYAASFAGYGFYGDVIRESEKYRWMGPKRYDYAGTKVFMRHRSYEAEVAYVATESDETSSKAEKDNLLSRLRSAKASNKSERLVCRINCGICRTSQRSTPYPCTKDNRWKRSKGRFLSIGAAIMSNRNERAPDGLVVDAHLSDGFLHLLLIRDCPRAFYLWHLTQLAKRGGKPLNFEFVEHHKTPAFTFTSVGQESVWNLDGELFPAHQLSAQVFRGLISLFATGPEI